MKKLLTILILIIISQVFCFSFAKDISVYNLNSNSAYILPLRHRPFDLSVSNNEVLRVGVVTEIFNTDSQLVIQTHKEGISYITYKFNDKEQVIKILVDNKSNIDLLEIDKPMEQKPE